MTNPAPPSGSFLSKVLTVYGVECALLSKARPGVRAWKGVDPDIGVIRVEREVEREGLSRWTIRRSSSLSWEREPGSKLRSKVQVVVTGSGKTFEEAVRALWKAEAEVNGLRIYQSMRRAKTARREEAEALRRREARAASTRVDTSRESGRG